MSVCAKDGRMMTASEVFKAIDGELGGSADGYEISRRIDTIDDAIHNPSIAATLDDVVNVLRQTDKADNIASAPDDPSLRRLIYTDPEAGKTLEGEFDAMARKFRSIFREEGMAFVREMKQLREMPLGNQGLRNGEAAMAGRPMSPFESFMASLTLEQLGRLREMESISGIGSREYYHAFLQGADPNRVDSPLGFILHGPSPGGSISTRLSRDGEDVMAPKQEIIPMGAVQGMLAENQEIAKMLVEKLSKLGCLITPAGINADVPSMGKDDGSGVGLNGLMAKGRNTNRSLIMVDQMLNNLEKLLCS